jgi:hypothetical protein
MLVSVDTCLEGKIYHYSIYLLLDQSSFLSLLIHLGPRFLSHEYTLMSRSYPAIDTLPNCIGKSFGHDFGSDRSHEDECEERRSASKEVLIDSAKDSHLPLLLLADLPSLNSEEDKP